MLGFRPSASHRYLPRPRLLGALPEAPGSVVVLEAPYGYGKSVLAGQWADRLERSGWRIGWLTLAERDPKAALAELLGSPCDTPWGELLERLWSVPTALVLEDLETLPDPERLSPILRDVRGALLLASRAPVRSTEVPRLVTEGRLLQLGPEALAFTPAEAAELGGDPEVVAVTWRRTEGWPLPLHFACLTGELPKRDTLVAGVRASLAEAEWEEALLLAALTHLPEAGATAATRRLADQGFAQRIEIGYRLHALIGTGILQVHHAAVQRITRREAPRLPRALRAEAFERAGSLGALADLLDEPDGQLERQAPEAVLRWDDLAPGPRGAARLRRVGWSRCALGDARRGLEDLLAGARHPAAAPDERLRCYRDAVWVLAQRGELDRAREVGATAEPLLPHCDGDLVGGYLNNLHMLHFEQGAWHEAEATLRRALGHLRSDEGVRAIAEGNLGIVRWHRDGDADALRIARRRALDSNRRRNPSNVPGDLLQLAEVHHLLGERETALELCREVPAWADAAPRWALEAEALHAFLEGAAERFPEFSARAALWRDDELADRVRFFHARTRLETGDAAAALAVVGDAEGFWSALMRGVARARLAPEAAEAALAVLPPRPSARRTMEEKLYWHAARYRIARTPCAFEDLLGAAHTGARLLPGLVPLAELPEARPELARPYPLAEVLASGRVDAVRLRLAEIRPLRLDLLGEFTTVRGDVRVQLGGRQRELLALLALRQPRGVIAEALWPGIDVARSRNNLYVQLSHLRRALEPWGVPTYLGEAGLDRCEVDLWRLEAALAAGDAERAAELYRSPLAPGVDLPLVDEVRGELQRRVIDTLAAAADPARPERTVRLMSRVLALEPLHEGALGHLLEALVAVGRRAEARRRYRAFRERLEGELGLEPLPETRARLA